MNGFSPEIRGSQESGGSPVNSAHESNPIQDEHKFLIAYKDATVGSDKLSDQELLDLVAKGEDLARDVVFVKDGLANYKGPLTKKDAAALMWYFMSKAAKDGQLYEKGMMRFLDEDAGNIVEFLKKCGGDYTYERISSHFSKEKEGEEYGIDFRSKDDGILPAGMKHMLFGKLKDGNSYVKMETYGCPPLFGKKSELFKSYAWGECIGHGYKYIKSLGAKEETGEYGSRRESVPYNIEHSFKRFMETTSELLPMSSEYNKYWTEMAISGEVETKKGVENEYFQKFKEINENGKLSPEEKKIRRIDLAIQHRISALKQKKDLPEIFKQKCRVLGADSNQKLSKNNSMLNRIVSKVRGIFAKFVNRITGVKNYEALAKKTDKLYKDFETQLNIYIVDEKGLPSKVNRKGQEVMLYGRPVESKGTK